MPNPFNVGSTWLIKRIGGADQSIKIVTTNKTTGEFTAKYVNIPDVSTFSGDFQEQDAEVISLKQRNTATGYFAFHIGIRLHDPHQPYKGHYCDTHQNNGGFSLSQIT